MARAVQPAPDGHSRPASNHANRHFVFVPGNTTARRLTIGHSQFPRHGVTVSSGGKLFIRCRNKKCLAAAAAGELELINPSSSRIFSPIPTVSSNWKAAALDRKSRFQPPHLLKASLHAYELVAVDLGDFIPGPLKMHRRPSDSSIARSRRRFCPGSAINSWPAVTVRALPFRSLGFWFA